MTDSPSKKSKFLLRVESDILNTLRELAEFREVSVSQLLRDILRDYVEKLTASSPPPRRKEKQWWS